MEIDEATNLRAIKMAPSDSVLFMFNLASGFNYNTSDVTVSEVKSVDPDGKAAVVITGLDNRGLTGVGPVTGACRFTYIRPDLGSISIPSDGTFFDIFRGTPNFLGAIEEFTRLTQYKCSADDFDELAFYPDTNGNRWLKAKANSWRFIGQLNLGRPRREDITEVFNKPVAASLSSYNGIYFNNIDRLDMNLVISHRPDDYGRLVVGMTLVSSSDSLVAFLLEHLHRKGVDAGFSLTPINGINLYAIRVEYKGVLRSGDVAPVPNVDRVIALSIAPVTGLWQSGEIRLFYNSKGTKTPSFAASAVTSLAAVKPVALPAYRSLLLAAKKGKRLAELSDARTVSEMFLAVTGIQYSQELYGDLVVEYNGPNRPYDQLPVGVTAAYVVVLYQAISMPSALSGKLKLFYEAG